MFGQKNVTFTKNISLAWLHVKKVLAFSFLFEVIETNELNFHQLLIKICSFILFWVCNNIVVNPIGWSLVVVCFNLLRYLKSLSLFNLKTPAFSSYLAPNTQFSSFNSHFQQKDAGLTWSYNAHSHLHRGVFHLNWYHVVPDKWST